MKYILTADIGTTAMKAAIFSGRGEPVASCALEYAFLTPAPGQAELSAEVYTDTFAEAVRTLIAQASVDPAEIAVIGFSTQGETTILLDERGEPLRRAILWCDTRAAEEAKEISRHFGAGEIQRRTGQVGEDAIWPGAKLLWIRKHEPEVFAKTAGIVQLEGWFSLLLTGRAAGEDSILGSSIYFDIRTRQWWPQMLEYLGIGEAQLPRIALPGEIVGQVTREAAARFGLAAGTPVSIGGIDLAVGAVGVGNIRPGSFSDVTGSALCTMAMTDEILLDPAMEMPCYCSAVPGLYMIHAYASGGICLRWFRDAFHGTLRKEVLRKEALRKEALRKEVLRKEVLRKEAPRKEALRKEVLREEVLRKEVPQKEGVQNFAPQKNEELQKETLQTQTEATGQGSVGAENEYDLMDLLAAETLPGADGLVALPHLTGSGPPDLCPEMKGALIGLTAAHGSGHIIRALMEGVAMILCRILEATENLGLTADRIVCLGGGAKSPVWCQIKADATGREVVTTDGYENAGCLGAAMLAGTAAGMFPSLEEAVAQLVHEDRRFLPDPEHAAVYRALRQQYSALMQCMLAVFR